MPVHLNRNPFHPAPREFEEGCLHIGLINNMPDGALQATERQFLTLLDSVADGVTIRLSLYALPGIPRTDWGQSYIRRFYANTEALVDSQLDGLIVTGTEPRAANLTDEPYWEPFTRVLDWAERNTRSTIWSCLAAHAAVLHLDGIGRRRLRDKLFGVFECEPASGHFLTAGAGSRLRMPHSRWNDVPETDLHDCGYRVLIRSADAGADTFVKQKNSLFLFFQGHPEYETNTLMLEYRREVGRYLRGERGTYPALPQDYFPPDSTGELLAFQAQALRKRSDELMADFPAPLTKDLQNTWGPTGASLYGNWLRLLATGKPFPGIKLAEPILTER